MASLGSQRRIIWRAKQKATRPSSDKDGRVVLFWYLRRWLPNGILDRLVINAVDGDDLGRASPSQPTISSRDEPGTTFILRRADGLGSFSTMPCDPLSVRF
jgi:hypothetical protein